jgi:ABC-type molybdate transport system ATPase subunit
MLSRLTRKASEALGLEEGTNVYAQVKAVALAPGRGELG